jgi:WhiB family redox-sensing transcriptional regulator
MGRLMAPIFVSYPDLTAPLNSIQPHRSAHHHTNNNVDEICHRPDWHLQAACRGHLADGLTWWFPHNRTGHSKQTAQAKQICTTCPVRQQCLDYAMQQTTDLQGIWGGLSWNERKQVRNGRPAPLPTYVKHGTQRSYAAGCECPKCTTAHIQYLNRSRAAKARQRAAKKKVA